MFFEFAIIGVTASGKTALAIEIAKEINAVILSLDSLCIYKQINIASAKPTINEMSQIRHFGINLVDVDQDFNVIDFINEYKKAKNFAQKNQIPLIITGGSGFYLKTMINGISPKIDDIKIDLNDDEIYEICQKIDPKFCEKFNKNDKFRMQKWAKIWFSTNEIPSIWLKKNIQNPAIQNIKIFEIIWDKEILKNRIKIRTKSMFENGLLKEAKYLFEKYDNNLKPLNSIGLKECKDYFNEKFGEIESEKAILECENLISLHTIQLAKRQRTFNKGQFLNRICGEISQIKELIYKNLHL